MLSVRGLVSGDVANKRVLDEVGLEVPDGSVGALLGSNGAGESTVLSAISGTLSMQGGVIHSGSIKLDGIRLHRSADHVGFTSGRPHEWVREGKVSDRGHPRSFLVCLRPERGVGSKTPHLRRGFAASRLSQTGTSSTAPTA